MRNDPLDVQAAIPPAARPLFDFAAGRRLGLLEGRRVGRRVWTALIVATFALVVAAFVAGVVVGGWVR